MAPKQSDDTAAAAENQQDPAPSQEPTEPAPSQEPTEQESTESNPAPSQEPTEPAPTMEKHSVTETHLASEQNEPALSQEPIKDKASEVVQAAPVEGSQSDPEEEGFVRSPQEQQELARLHNEVKTVIESHRDLQSRYNVLSQSHMELTELYKAQGGDKDELALLQERTAELETLKAAHKGLKDENARLKQQHDQHVALAEGKTLVSPQELEQLRKTASELAELRESYQTQRTLLETSSEVAQEQRERAEELEKQLTVAQIEVQEAQLQAMSEAEKQDILELKMQLKNIEIADETRKKQIESYTQELKLCDQNYASAVERLQRSIHEEKANAESANELLLIKTAACNEAVQQQYALQAEMETTRREMEALQQSLGCVGELEQQVQDKNAQIQAVEQQLLDTQKALADEASTVDHLNIQLTILVEQAKHTVQQEELTAQSSLEHTRESLQAEQEQNQKLTKELKELRKTLQSALIASATAQGEANLHLKRAETAQEQLRLLEFDTDIGHKLALEQLQTELETERKHCGNLQAELLASHAACENALANQTQAEEQIEYLQEDRNTTYSQTEKLKLEIRESIRTSEQQLMQKLENELSHSKEELKTTRNEMHAAKEELRAARQSLEYASTTEEASGQPSKQHEEEMRQLVARLEHEDAKLKACLEEIKACKELTKREKDRADNLVKELELWQKGMDKGSHAIRTAMRNEVREAEARFVEIQQQFEATKLKLELTTQELHDQHVLVKHIKQVSKDAPQMVAALEQSNQEQGTLIAELRGKIVHLEEELHEREGLEAVISTLTAESDEARQEASKLQIQVDDLEMELASWRTNAMVDEMRDQLDEERTKRIELDGVGRHLAQCQNELKEARDELGPKEEALQISQENLFLQIAECEQMREELHSARQTIVEAHRHSTHLQNQLSMANTKNEAMDDDIHGQVEMSSQKIIASLRVELEMAHNASCCGNKAQRLSEQLAATVAAEHQAACASAVEQMEQKAAECEQMRELRFALQDQWVREKTELVANQETMAGELAAAQALQSKEAQANESLRSELCRLKQELEGFCEVKMQLELKNEVCESLGKHLQNPASRYSLETFTSEMERLTSTNAELNLRLKKLQGEENSIRSLTAEKEALTAELATCKNLVEDLKESVLESGKQCSQVERARSEAEAELQQYRIEQATSEQARSSHTEMLERAEMERDSAQAKAAEMKVLKDEADAKALSYEKELSLSKSFEYLMHIRASRDQFADAAAVIGHAADEWDDLKKELENKGAAAAELAVLRDECKQMKEHMKQAEKSIEESQQEVHNHTTGLELCMEQYRATREEFKKYVRDFERVQQENMELSAKILEADTNARYAEFTLRSVERELQDWQQDNGVDGAATAKLQAELKELGQKQNQVAVEEGQLELVQARVAEIAEAEARAAQSAIDLGTQLDVTTRALHKAEQQLAQASAQAQAALEMNRDSEQKWKASQETVSGLEQQLAELKTEHESLILSQKDSANEIGDWKAKLEAATAEIQILAQSGSDDPTAAQLREELEQERTKASILKQSIEKMPLLEHKCEDLTQKCMVAEQSVEKLSHDMKQLTKQSEIEKEDLKREVRQLTEVQDTLTQNVSGLEQQLSQTKEDLAQTTAALALAQAPVLELEVQIEPLKEQLAVLKSLQVANHKDAEAANAADADLKVEMTNAAAAAAKRIQEIGEQYQGQVKTAEADLEQANKLLRGLEAELITVKGVVKQQEATGGQETQMNPKMEHMQKEIEQKVQALHESEAEVKALRQQVAELQGTHLHDIDALEVQCCLVSSLKKELVVVRTDLESITEAAAALKVEASGIGMAGQIADYKSQIASIQEDRDKLIREFESLHGISAAQAKNLEMSHKNETQLKQKCQQMATELRTAQASVIDGSVMSSKVTERVASLEGQLQMLQEDKLLRELTLRNDVDRERERGIKCDAQIRKLEDKLRKAEQTLQENKTALANQAKEAAAYHAEIEYLTSALEQQEANNLAQCSYDATLRWQAIVWQDERDRAVEDSIAARVEIANLRENGLFLESEMREQMGLNNESDGDLRTQLADQVNQLNLKIAVLNQENQELTKQGRQPPCANGHELTVAPANSHSTPNIQEPKALQEARPRVDPTLSPEDQFSLMMQDSIAEQLAGDVGHRARGRAQKESTFTDAGRYVLWKARYALEHARASELASELKALQLKYEGDEVLSAQREYEHWKYAAYTQDFRDLLQLGFIGITGRDRFNIPVVVVAAANLPAGAVSFDRLLKFLIYVLDDLADDTYHIVYINSENGSDSPELDGSWLKRAIEVLPLKYQKNLCRLFVLHTNFSFKMFYMGNKSVLKDSTLEKISYVDSIEELFSELGRRATVLPGYAYDHEGTLHPSRELLVKSKRQGWNKAMEQEEVEAKKKLLQRDLSTLDFLSSEKLKFVRAEKYADAELIKDEMAALHEEINALRGDLIDVNVETDDLDNSPA